MTRLLTMPLLMLFSAVVLMASQQAVTRVEGVITDEATGAPVGCKVYVTTPSGKSPQPTNSNSKDGTYLILFNEAGLHQVSIRGHNVLRRDYTITIPPTTKFADMKQDFKVTAIKQGEKLFSTKGFERNAAAMSAAGRQELERVIKLLRENQEMQVVITVRPDEDQVTAATAAASTGARAQHDKDMKAYDKALKDWKKKSKKDPSLPKPTEPTLVLPTVEDPNIALLKQRQSAVQEAMKDVKNADLRVSVVTEALPAPTVAAAPVTPEPAATSKQSKKTKKTTKTSTPAAAAAPHYSHDTMIGAVGKVKKLFD
jgi:hypothetical protein